MITRIGLLAAVLIASNVIGAAAEEQMKLFKLVSPKDEVVVGLSADELRGFGPAADIDNFAAHLATAGEMSVWQYAVRKDQSGALQQAPLRRIAVFKNDTVRIEPYTSPLPVVAPQG